LPTLSVVVTGPAGDDASLLASLTALADPCRHAGAELLLATPAAASAAVRRRLPPACRVLSVDPAASTPALRLAGVRAASGDVVFFVDGAEPAQERRVIDRLEGRRISVMSSDSRTAHETGREDSVTPLSVIMPAHQSEAVLPRTLEALRASDLPAARWELIVVDDASTDDTAAIASLFADVLLRIPLCAHGPAYARNRGFEISVGAAVLFIDADVEVNADTLRRFASALETESSASAIVGSYDPRSTAPGIVSQYRNLLHCYMHREGAGDADAFWAAGGAIRRSAFAQSGMYDEWHYSRPTIEGVELGQRMRALGHRIVVRPDIRVTHLKTWSLRSAISSDLRDHGVPWMRLAIQQWGRKGDRISPRAVERINTIGTWIALVSLLMGAVVGDPRWVMTMVISLLPVLFANRRLYAYFERERGVAFALAVIPLHLLYYVLLGVAAMSASALHVLVGDPRPAPVVEAFAEVGHETWPPVPNRLRTLATMHPSAARG
jgi:glycosyltransferase involved in cell wall biosynthesis